MRYIGVDLHTTQITVCYLTEKEEVAIQKYQICEIERFVAGLSLSDEIAVEATSNTRWFVEQVRSACSRVVLVNPRQFDVVKNSVKKTDRNDAINLAIFLKADMLPEVRVKKEEADKVQSLVGTRTKLVRLKTSLMNKIHALSVSKGRKLRKTSLASEKGLEKVLEEGWTQIERIELDIIIEQIRSLKAGIKKLDTAIATESEKLTGYRNLVSISGIGSLSAGILLSVIGEVKDFANADKLASYFGIVPRVSNSNETVNHGTDHETWKQNGPNNTRAMLSGGDQEKRLLEEVLRTDQSETRPRKSQNCIGKKVLGNNLQHPHQQLGVCRLQQF